MFCGSCRVETRHCGRPSHPSYCRGAGRGAVLSLSAAVGRGGAESGLCESGPAGNGSAGAALCEGKTWTTDGFFRETRERWNAGKNKGCVCVEMECAALAAVAQFRKVDFAAFFYTADNLDAPEWDVKPFPEGGFHFGKSVYRLSGDRQAAVGKNCGNAEIIAA